LFMTKNPARLSIPAPPEPTSGPNWGSHMVYLVRPLSGARSLEIAQGELRRVAFQRSDTVRCFARIPGFARPSTVLRPEQFFSEVMLLSAQPWGAGCGPRWSSQNYLARAGVRIACRTHRPRRARFRPQSATFSSKLSPTQYVARSNLRPRGSDSISLMDLRQLVYAISVALKCAQVDVGRGGISIGPPAIGLSSADMLPCVHN